MNLPMVDRLVNALLYEGYLLYPYRASAIKNRLRFNFGVLYPRAYAEAQSGNDRWTMQTQCLAEGESSAALQICFRFLRIVDRTIEEAGGLGNEFRAVPSIEVEGQIYEAWQEGMERRVDLPATSIEQLVRTPLRHEFLLPREHHRELLRDAQGRIAGAIVRNKPEMQGVIEVSAEPITSAAWRVTVRIANMTEFTIKSGNQRDEALGRSLISAHTVLGIEGGEFVSLLDPPGHLQEAAANCRNEGTWPVLVGDPADRSTLLSSPIILYDYPAIAPESPGDLCDSTEIDEILTLRVLTMTEREKEEARRIDERARRILQRTEELDPETFSKLHGVFRGAGGNS